MREQHKISDAERVIMHVLWEQPNLSSQQIIAVLTPKKNWAPTTIKTLLQRLVKKNMISRVQSEQKRFLYAPCVSEKDTMVSLTENLLLQVCSRKMGKTLADLIEILPLTHDDLALLSGAIDAKKSSAVDTLPCNCITGLCSCPEHQTGCTST